MAHERKRRNNHGPSPASKALVDLAAWKIGTAFVLLGLGLLYLSFVIEGSRGPDAIDATVREVGALLLVTGVLGVFWEVLGRRSLTRELLSAAELSSDITSAGLKRIATRYLDIEWDSLLESANHVDLFFAYGRTWRSAHATPLRHLVERDGTRLRVILPDRDNAALMDQLAAKFRYPADELIANIDNAESDFANLRTQLQVDGLTCIVRTNDQPPQRLKALIEDPSVLKIFHHAMFDLRFIAHRWDAIASRVACTKITSKLIDPRLPCKEHSLKALVSRYLGIQLDKGPQRSDWTSDLTSEQLLYAANDVLHLWPLYERLERETRRMGLLSLQERCFEHICTRVELEVGGFPDVFAY